MRASAATLFVVAPLFVSCADDASAFSPHGPYNGNDASLASNELPPALEAMWREHPLWQSGTRLRANIEDGAEGAARFVASFTDTQLDVSCSLALASDGELRCLPIGDGTSRYLDAACKQPALVYANTGTPTCPTSPLVVGGGASPYLVAGSVPKQVVYRNENGKCVGAAAYDCIYSLKPAPVSIFLRGTVRAQVIDNAVSLNWIEYEDGARVAGAITDRKRGSTCSPSPSDRCEPETQGYVELRKSRRDGEFAYFADANCKRPAAVSFVGKGGKPSSVYSLEDYECSPVYSYHSVGDKLSVGYRLIDGRCERAPADRPLPLFELKKKLDPETFPRLLRARAGSGRLQLEYFASLDGRPLMTGELYDSQFALGCSRTTFADGTTRCMPRRTSEKHAEIFYSDPTCADGTEVVGVTANGCGLQPFAVEITQGVSVERVHWIGAVIAEPEQLFERRDECLPVPRNPGTEPLTFRWLGDEIELAQIDQRLE